MTAIFPFFPEENSYLFLILLAVVSLWLLCLSFLYWRAVRHYRALTKGLKQKGLEALLEEHLKKIDSLAADLSTLKSTVSLMREEDLQHLQRVGFVRFNPFKEVGGDQSFAIALLDGRDNGLVLSSLHGREGTRLYAKPVEKGKEKEYSLSEEEKSAVERARG